MRYVIITPLQGYSLEVATIHFFISQMSMNVQKMNSTTVIRSAMSLVMDGMTAPVKMDSLSTMMDIHAMVCVLCVCVLLLLLFTWHH